jgi:predicted phosphodiesterase
MRLAVFSDIHGNLMAFEAALADLEALGGADRIWILGDLAAFGPRPAECIRRVKELVGEEEGGPKDGASKNGVPREETRPKVRAISGNTDRYLVTGERMREAPAADEQTFQTLAGRWHERDLRLNWTVSQMSHDDYAYLQKLGSELHVTAEGYGPVIGYHAVPGNDETILNADTSAEEALDLMMDREGRLGVGGHIHRQYDRDLGRWRIINVGSVGLSFDQPGMAQWGLFTFENGQAVVDLRNVPYDVEAVVADLQAVGHPSVEWVASKLRTS